MPSSSSSSRPNLWALVDSGADVAAIRSAVDAMPSCLNVCAWSYITGKRRGLALQQARSASSPPASSPPDGQQPQPQPHPQLFPRWVVSDDPTAQPGTVLHFAVATGRLDVATLAIELGANVATHLGEDPSLPSAAEMAAVNAAAPTAARRAEDEASIHTLLAHAAVRQSDPCGRLADDEQVQRRIVELHESSSFLNIANALNDGVTTLSVVLKDGSGGPAPVFAMTVPRYTSCRTLTQLIEQLVGQRVLVSFQIPVWPSVVSPSEAGSGGAGGGANDATNQHNATLSEFNGTMNSTMLNTTMTSTGHNTTFSGTMTSTMPRRGGGGRRGAAGASSLATFKTVELRNSTAATLLHLPSPACIARPLVTGLVLPPAPVADRRGGRHSPVEDAGDADIAAAAAGGDADARRLAQLMRELKAATAASSDGGRRSLSRTSAVAFPSTAADEPQEGNDGNTADEQLTAQQPPPHRPVPDIIADIKKVLDVTSHALGMDAGIDTSTFAHVGGGGGGSKARHRTASPTASVVGSGRVLTQEDLDAAVNRLYTQALAKITENRTSRDAYIVEGAKRLENRPDIAGKQVTPEMEESLDRLCGQAMARKQEKLTALADAVWETVPKPPETTDLSPEDAELSRLRLTNPDHKKDVMDSAASKVYGADNELKRHKKKISKEGVSALIDSVYSSAIAKKAATLEALTAQYGDFIKRKPPCKKLNMEELRAMADKLSKKN